jgi:hypothetical protein
MFQTKKQWKTLRVTFTRHARVPRMSTSEWFAKQRSPHHQRRGLACQLWTVNPNSAHYYIRDCAMLQGTQWPVKWKSSWRDPEALIKIRQGVEISKLWLGYQIILQCWQSPCPSIWSHHMFSGIVVVNQVKRGDWIMADQQYDSFIEKGFTNRIRTHRSEASTL